MVTTPLIRACSTFAPVPGIPAFLRVPEGPHWLLAFSILTSGTLPLACSTSTTSPTSPLDGKGLLHAQAVACSDQLRSHIDHDSEQDQHSERTLLDDQPPLGFSLTEAWFDAWPHRHFSRRGTPFSHLFVSEPAFLDRDLFLDFRSVRGGAEADDAYELEAELEWALTRRIGMVVEIPYLFLDPNAGDREDGFGDLAVASRFLLLETDRLLVSANFEVEAPTGNDRRGLGRGEAAISPTVSWWFDLGAWFAWSGHAGSEHGLESGEDEVLYNTALTYSFLGPALHGDPPESHSQEGRHFPPGLVNLITEVTARTNLSGRDRGRDTAEILVGASYLVTSAWEARVGVQFPLFTPKELDNALIFGLVYHF